VLQVYNKSHFVEIAHNFFSKNHKAIMERETQMAIINPNTIV
jgi:hypothetical protein